MTQQVRTRTREAEPPGQRYEGIVKYLKDLREQRDTGAVVIRNKDMPWETARQGRLKYLCYYADWDKHAAPGWMIFMQDIRRHSGKHVHQGGTHIFVLEGRGYTIVNGKRYDWEAGDLILLPITPGGCEHQHFNIVEGEPCKWVALVWHPLKEVMGNEITQREVSPDWKPG